MNPDRTEYKETLIAHYRPYTAGYDEMVAPTGEVRPHWQYLASALSGLNPGEFDQRHAESSRLLRENGVTYRVYGDPAGGERPWPLDLIPLLFPSEEWRRIESGLTQRAEVLNLLLRDIYGPRDLIRRGLLPAEFVYGHPGFLRPCHPMNSQKPHSLILYAADLARGPDGRMSVLSDRTQAPSGSGYALENRTVLSQVFPSVYRDSHVHRLAVFFQDLRASLAAYAPNGADDPRVVILTPGPLNETYFEHVFLANYLGYSLVRGDELVVRDGRVWLRSLKGLEPVDVIWRRVDDNYCDPLELLPDSDLGIPGLVEAVREGHVVVANPLGASVLENPALHAFLPAIAEHLLGRPLEFPTVATWWCGRMQERRYVIAHLDRMVVRTVHRLAGARPIYGSLLSREQRAELARRIEAQPHLYVGQDQVTFSCAPTLIDGRLAAHHAVLRAFLIARDDGYVVMPGGLTRVAPSEDNLIVSNQAGGIAKDTWIIASEPEKQASLLPTAGAIPTVSMRPPSLPPREADNLFWFARYAERSEQSMRLLRTIFTAFQSVTQFDAPYQQETLQALRQALSHITGIPLGLVGTEAPGRRAEPTAELVPVLSNPELRGGVAFNLRAMLEAAHGVRDPLSSDTRHLINHLQERLDALQSLSHEHLLEIQEELNQLITALAGLAGLVMEGMFRGEAWLFWEIGRRLERSLLLVSLLRGTLVLMRPRPVETTLLETVLRTCDSLTAYRRLHNAPPEATAALALLLSDESSPRALAFQLARLEKHVAALPREAGDIPLSEEARLIREASDAMRRIDLDAMVRTDPATGRREALDERLTRVEQLLWAASEAVGWDYFTDARGPRQQLGTEPPS
jgi:uncharacterized circularly permuted ATP-grasp superfamily protein/uncharacterized alpha-E superfamily protein